MTTSAATAVTTPNPCKVLVQARGNSMTDQRLSGPRRCQNKIGNIKKMKETNASYFTALSQGRH
ncbi:hypothetical protein [Herbaspirillum sp. Sphag1AN]|uniref:hypothetical protein n=1 Tax=Herbaspirillum sp. Sphag1AN TaxID=2587030 RepID=UPI001C852443|nr:hypothetical protein [Herbaspirillum sp. Sphag1AN]